jgi:hypothetical protein
VIKGRESYFYFMTKAHQGRHKPRTSNYLRYEDMNVRFNWRKNWREVMHN